MGGRLDSQKAVSSVAQTANVGRSTSVTSGAAKVFREFKWGLLTLFLLMVVVIGLVYDGGKKKKLAEAKPLDPAPVNTIDTTLENNTPPVPTAPAGSQTQQTPPVTNKQPPEIEGATPLHNGALGTSETLPRVEPKTVVTPPPGPAKPETTTTDRVYTVKAGDTLTSIANTMLPGKGNIKAILDVNKDVLPNPNKLRPNMTLKIPAVLPAPAEATAKADPKKADAPKEKDVAAKDGNAKAAHDGKEAKDAKETKASEYTVQAGDTLERIARKVFNDGRKWREIYEWNRETLADPGHLRSGQVLKLKHAASATSAGTTRADTEPVPATTTATTSVAIGSATKEEVPAQAAQAQVMSSTSPASLP
jgi:nucleoid-associated protein YgaU